MSNVKIVRMTSGEEILCTIVKEDANNILIEDPTIIIPTQDRNIGLAPWMPYADTAKISIKQTFVAFIVDPVEQLAEQYRSIHSKIITPNQRIVGS